MESVDDILQGLRGWQQTIAVSQPLPDGPAHVLLDQLHAAPMSSESLAGAVQQPLAQVLAELTELEIEGLVACENGFWVARTG